MQSSDKMREVLFSLGERLGFILVIFLGISFFFFEKTSPAFSETSDPQLTSPQFITHAPPQVQEQSKVVEGVAYIKKQLNSDEPVVFDATITPSPTTQTDQQFTPSSTPTVTPTLISKSPTPSPIPTATETPTPTIAPVTPTPTVVAVDPNSDDIWNKIAECESHQNWSIDTGNGYFGGLQFSQGTWNSVGGSGNPASASREEQISRAKQLQQMRGWGVWGACAQQLGLN
jgi:hypothetical protein